MIKTGDIVYGKITNILGYGAFVTVDAYSGLIHISEFSDNYVKSIHDYVKVGQQVKLKVLDVDEANKRLRLSYKFLNKSRGVKGKVPTYEIGFKTLKDKIDDFIKVQIDGVEDIEEENKNILEDILEDNKIN